MSSQKTTNYDLNQWLPDDSVLRTDFNADNAKIDAALQALAQEVAAKPDQSALEQITQQHTADVLALRSERPWVKLGEATLDADAESISVTISNVEQYHHLILTYTTAGGRYTWLTWNGSNLKYLFAYTGTGGQPAEVAAGKVEFYPIYGQGIHIVYGLYAQSSEDTTRNSNTDIFTGKIYSGTVSIGLKESYSDLLLSAGTHIEVYGVKK